MTDEESIYQLLFENSGQGMVLWQGDKLVIVNQSFADIVGYTIDELLAFSLEDTLNLVHPEDREALLVRRKDRFVGKPVPDNFEYRFIRKSGEIGYWSATVATVEYQGHPAIVGIYEDITDRKKIEASSAHGQKLLASTLNVLPIGVCLTDESGCYRLMNDAYCAIYEYEREEILGQHYSVIMPPDQIELANAHYAQLLTGDVGIPTERKRQRKDGSIVYIEAANALVEGEDGQKMVITTVRDITERKQGEEIVQLRLKLIDFASTHPYNELMQKALDEIGELMNSPIGFYHFVDENQHSLSLQAWSTRTLEEFCQTEEQGMHYPIDEAGVWTDCVHQRKPVIHNNYATLPHRKGLPDGHAKVVRELVVPIIRDDQVVAILGIGNKPSDYNEQDTELVAYIADLVWSIVEKKQAEEKIHQLNNTLERLAMTDELTGLPNRRAFFMQGAKEISRAQRHKTPFSLLMLDIDGFKKINDSYGHDAGDIVLQQFSNILVQIIRDIDMVGRMGGEEFCVLLPNTEIKNAVKLAERIRLTIEQEGLQIKNQIISLTVSIGVAADGKSSSNLASIIKRADDCMYQAKNQGKNRVVYLD
jgi:diguanylate cyclase (GGDEF)-like protein/PAS domain S-box-containing protein